MAKEGQNMRTGLAVAVCVLLFLLYPARAGAPDCNCWHGVISQSLPRCLCTCDTGYLEPRCQYTSTDEVRVEIWFNFPITQFDTANIIATLQANLLHTTQPTYPAYGLIYGRTSDSVSGVSAGLFKMPGGAVFYLERSVEAKAAWVQSLGITSVYPVLKTSASSNPAETLAASVVLYETSSGVVITADTLAWLIGAFILAFIIIFIDMCCFKNTSSNVEDAMQQGGLGGMDAGRKYKNAA